MQAADGSACACGNNFSGEWGNPVGDSAATPVPVLGAANIASIDAGQPNGMAVGKDGIL